MSKLKNGRTEPAPSQLSYLTPAPLPVSREGLCAHLGQSLRGSLVEAMRPSPLSRWQIAGKISEIMNREISKAMLDAYCAESHESHRIPAEVLPALCVVCDTHRPLHIIAEAMGCVAVPVLRAAERADIHTCVQSAFLRVVHELGSAAHALEESLRDNKLTRLEAARCRRELTDLIRAAVTVSHALEAAL